MKIFYKVTLLATFVLFGTTSATYACPSCQMAIESAGDDADSESMRNLGRAYNQSIYLFMTMPFLLLGAFGFLVYRGLKQNESVRRAQLANLEANEPVVSEPQ